MKILRVLLVTVLVVAAGQTFPANAQTETNLYSFAGAPDDGSNPAAGLVQGSDGDFYGTTSSGGTNGAGTVFEFSLSAGYTNLYAFAGPPSDGSDPVAALVQGSDSNFYGTTSSGGTSGNGTVFQINPSGTYTTLYSFAGLPADGSDPSAGLVQGSDGNFYGTTYFGGTTSGFNHNGNGTVFQISPSGTYTTLYFFAGYPTDGADPAAGLVQGSDSNFYGTTQFGGTSTNCGAGCGTVFRISADGSYTTLYSFVGSPNDGSYPVAGLVEGSDSNFYGTTSGGGTNGNGTIFRFSRSGTYTSLYSFVGPPNDGKNPSGALVQGSDSNFYGTTFYGGTTGHGTAFRISPGGNYTSLYSFAGSPSAGANPSAGLVRGSDSNLYGTTVSGGKNGDGALFEFAFSNGSGNTNCAFSIVPTTAGFNAAGGSASVSVIASNGCTCTQCTWTATTTNTWITIDSGGSGTGTGTVSYTVSPNATTNILKGTMTIASQVFTVMQYGASTVGNCIFTLNTTSAKFSAKGGSKSVRVKAPATGCSWTAITSDPFITITSGNSGSGNGKVAYTVLGNTNTTALTGTMLIAGQTFTVKQAAGGCKFSLSPKKAKLKAINASGIIKVKPKLSNCAWTAVSNDSFISITSGGSGVGKGTVGYLAAPNANSVARTGTITIGDKTFTVIQSGAK